MDSLLTYAEPFLQGETRGLFHKGQDVDTELNEAAKDWLFSYTKHPSNTDSQAVILEVWEVRRVGSQVVKA
jgi:16S rRNA (guanine527-N7)-methyltransferase